MVNLLYSKPLSEYSLLPVNKHIQTHSLNLCSHLLWPCCFIFGNMVYVTQQGLLKIILLFVDYLILTPLHELSLYYSDYTERNVIRKHPSQIL